MEYEKVHSAVEMGAEAIMDLSSTEIPEASAANLHPNVRQ